MSQLRNIQDALVEATSKTRNCDEVGGCIAMLTDDPLVWLNYAVPLREMTPEDAKALKDHFIANKRRPRLELFQDLWPESCRSLEAEGFVCTHKMPMMTLDASGFKTAQTIARLAVPGDGWTLEQIQSEAFSGTPSEERAKSTDENIANGSLLASLTEIDSIAVACGFGIGTREIKEIAGIGTLEAYRRRGAARAVIAVLLNKFFEDGGQTAWLTPGDDGAQSLYTSIGFQPKAMQVCYEHPAL